MLQKDITGTIYLSSNRPEIGSKFQPFNAAHKVDGVYWERMPALNDYECMLQRALLANPTNIISYPTITDMQDSEIDLYANMRKLYASGGWLK
jgi:hypothetical protein